MKYWRKFCSGKGKLKDMGPMKFIEESYTREHRHELAKVFTGAAPKQP
jgi:hypothetical protein